MEAHEPLFETVRESPKDLFPHGQVREGQRQFLEDARSCMSHKVHLLAHAPTGLGKTAVALTAALETSLNEGGMVFFLTARQSQHRIAIETLRQIWRRRRVKVVDLISKEDSCLCRRKAGDPPCTNTQECYFLDRERVSSAAQRLLDYPLHVDEASRSCVRQGACPYLAALEAVQQADVVVCDYNQVFGREDTLLERIGNRQSETILIVDEAHNLPARIQENFSDSLSRAKLQSIVKATGHQRFQEILRDLLAQWDRWAFEENGKALDPHVLEELLLDRHGIDCQGLALEMEAYYGERAKLRLRPLLDLLTNWSANGQERLLFMDPSSGALHHRFLEPGLVASTVLERVRCALFMSGTLHPPERYADLLGIREVAVCRRYPSPFPAENRSILAVDGLSSRYVQRDDGTFQAMADRIAQVCRSTPGNVIAFLPSYAFLSAVQAKLRTLELSKRLLCERQDMAKAEREALLNDLARDRSALLMANISGSLAEGVDFKDNLLDAVVVVGYPLCPPSLEGDVQWERLSKRLGEHKASLYVHTYPAISKVLQAAGRAIRSEKDRAAIILLDDRYLKASVRSSFPDDFQMVKSEDLSAELSSFFARSSCSELGEGAKG